LYRQGFAVQWRFIIMLLLLLLLKFLFAGSHTIEFRLELLEPGQQLIPKAGREMQLHALHQSSFASSLRLLAHLGQALHYFAGAMQLQP
jgi:hypothetical protein